MANSHENTHKHEQSSLSECLAAGLPEMKIENVMKNELPTKLNLIAHIFYLIYVRNGGCINATGLNAHVYVQRKVKRILCKLPPNKLMFVK